MKNILAMLFCLDGRETDTVTTLEGNTLSKVQVPDSATGYHTTHEVNDGYFVIFYW